MIHFNREHFLKWKPLRLLTLMQYMYAKIETESLNCVTWV